MGINSGGYCFGFISFQPFKSEKLNLPILGSRDDFIIQRDAVDRVNAIKNVLKSSSFVAESQAISELCRTFEWD